MDVDFFKEVNDKYGHEAGDKVLVHLADILRRNVRENDYVIRWGGEEFLVIMPGLAYDKVNLVAEQLRAGIEKSNNEVCTTTISIGVARYDGNDYHATIRKADEALYEAKNSGRNKVISYE